ncbi:hypothetical protein ACFQ3B_05285 [Stackebrandtia endophytica]|nr:hypothetical protein [Stackebrandtia endophytica]
MSKFSDLLNTRRSDDSPAVPSELDRAWTWMESRGWIVDNGNDYYLTPYAGEQQLGVVFAAHLSLEGWFEPDEAGFDQLIPFVELDGAGSVGVLWNGEDGHTRIGALGGEGHVSLLAENALDFLRLIAIGYDEVGSFLDGEPEEPESVEAHAEFRTWVQSEFGVEVPAHWHYADPDPFNSWVARLKGTEYSPFD